MRVRQQDINGDYIYGNTPASFYIDNNEAVAQLVVTNLKLNLGDFFLDVTQGVPYATEVLGYNTAQTRDLVIQDAILNTQGVASIVSYSSNFIAATRSLSITAKIMTIYDSIITIQQVF